MGHRERLKLSSPLEITVESIGAILVEQGRLNPRIGRGDPAEVAVLKGVRFGDAALQLRFANSVRY